MTVFTNDLLLIAIKIKAAITQGTVGLSDANILDIATRRLQIDIAAQILQKKEEYLLQLAQIPLVANQDYYRIPYRALGSTLRHIYWVNSSGTTRYPLDRLYQEDVESFCGNQTSSIPRSFIIDGNNVRLVPSVGANPTGTLNIEYFFRPNQLVPVSYTRQIQTISGSTVTLASMPSQLSGLTTFDIINNISGNEIIQYDVSGTVSGNTITFSTDAYGNALSSNVKAGCWVAAPMTSPVPMIPEEFQQLLIAFTVLDIQQFRGNQAGIQVAMQDIQAISKAVEELTSQRALSKPELVIPRNPLSRMRLGGQRYGRY